MVLAKAGFATRRVPKTDMHTLLSGAMRPRTGDVVLARVDRIRQQERIELPTGRKAALEKGDELVLACGNRYATDQYEGLVPRRLGRANLIAAGGVAAVETERARRMKPATEITLLGLVGDESGLPLNLMSYALPIPNDTTVRPPVTAVFGTSMNSGKTTTAQFLTRGLTLAGYRVGYAKLTGTGAGHDYWGMYDSGASAVVDFTDAGFASTYKIPIAAIESLSVNLIAYLAANGCDRIVVEIADGLLQEETAAVIDSEVFHRLIDRVLFASGDAMAAIAGVSLLQEHGFVVAGVAGLVTASPLPCREATCACGVPVWRKADLTNPQTAAAIAVYSSPSDHTSTCPDHRNTQGETTQGDRRN